MCVRRNNGDPACWRAALRLRPRSAGCVMRCAGTTEIPPAGAPSGGRGSLCGNVWLSRSPLHPVCRFAQDDT